MAKVIKVSGAYRKGKLKSLSERHQRKREDSLQDRTDRLEKLKGRITMSPEKKNETKEPKTEEQKKEEWKKAEESQIPHPHITPNPAPLSAGVKTVEPPPITVEEQMKQSIPTDPIAAHDTPASNKAFRESIEDKMMEAAGHPEPLRVGNELTRMENGVIQNFGKVIALQNFLDSTVRDKLNEEDQKKLDSLLIAPA